jgi:hypothetical protein
MQHRALLCLSAVLLASGCDSPAEAPEPAAEARAIGLPASALAGAVRVLETLDAVRPAGALTQVRALEGDTRVDPARGAESVRVFLHLTVYADTNAAARAAFEELRAALETEARSTARIEPASAERVARVTAGLDWDPPGREDLVSYSDVVRVELAPGRSASEAAGGVLVSGPPAYDSLASYVRNLAAREHIGGVELSVSPASVARSVNDHRFRIQEGPDGARNSLAEIGGFLSALERGSPAARLTRLKIERSQHEPDVHATRGWTFEAELCVRTFDAGAPRTASAVTGR